MYSKLFSSVVHSSLWSEPDHIRLLFITLLALADRDGIVYGSRSGLERAAMIDPDQAEENNPWDRLMGPDTDSSDLMRNPENEGRRIEEIPGGFRLINYEYYKALRDAEERKVQNREAQRRHRQKISHGKPASATVSHRKPIESKIESKNKEEGANGSHPAAFSVETWLSELEKEDCYKGVNVRQEYGKCSQWCSINRKILSKRRFVNWINRAEKPLIGTGIAKPTYKRNYMPPARVPTDEELTHAREIARLEARTLRAKLKPS